jgi:hypothetical protein
MLSHIAVNCQAVVAAIHVGDSKANAVTCLHVERLAQGNLTWVVHALNAIGLSAKVATIFGVKPIFLANASRVGFESAGTWSGVGNTAPVIAISVRG